MKITMENFKYHMWFEIQLVGTISTEECLLVFINLETMSYFSRAISIREY